MFCGFFLARILAWQEFWQRSSKYEALRFARCQSFLLPPIFSLLTLLSWSVSNSSVWNDTLLRSLLFPYGKTQSITAVINRDRKEEGLVIPHSKSYCSSQTMQCTSMPTLLSSNRSFIANIIKSATVSTHIDIPSP